MRISDWSSDVCSSDLLIDFAVLIISTDGDPHARCGVVRQAQLLVEVTNISVVGDIIIVLPRSAVIRRPAITLIVRICSDRGQGKDRKSVGWGRSVTGRVELGGCGNINTKNKNKK